MIQTTAHSDEVVGNVAKTGTVNIGIVCKEGIVLAADRKISFGGGGGVAYVGGKIKKILQLNERLIMSMAGTASDALRNIAIITAELRLKELRTKTNVSVKEAAHLTSNMLFNNIRTPSMIPSIAHFLLAGYDEQGAHLFDLSPDGYLKEITTCVSSGSGMVQADPILDTEYKKGLSLEEGIKLASKCIKASAGRDPAVGEGIDIYTITKEGIKQIVSEEMVSVYK